MALSDFVGSVPVRGSSSPARVLAPLARSVMFVTVEPDRYVTVELDRYIVTVPCGAYSGVISPI